MQNAVLWLENFEMPFALFKDNVLCGAQKKNMDNFLFYLIKRVCNKAVWVDCWGAKEIVMNILQKQEMFGNGFVCYRQENVFYD